MNKTVQNVNNEDGTPGETDVMVRKYGEAVINTLSSVASVLEYPKGTKISNDKFLSVANTNFDQIFFQTS